MIAYFAAHAGRHRWVIFGDLNWPSGQEPSTVPPEWHGWLHCTVDQTPSQVQGDAELRDF
jgi:NADH:ubiquinone oxidoreductase subunit